FASIHNSCASFRAVITYVRLHLYNSLMMYMDSTGASNTSIDTLANLGLTTTSRTITRIKNFASEEHAIVVDSELVKYTDKAIVLNIDNYHSIHTEYMPNTTTTSAA